MAEVPVTLSTESDYVSVAVDGTIEAQLPNDVTGDDFEWSIDLPESVEAPVQAGDQLGTLTVTLNGETYGTVNLDAVNDVDRSEWLVFRQRVNQIVHSWQFILIVVLIVALVVALIVRAKVVASRSGRYNGRRSRGRNGGNYRGKR